MDESEYTLILFKSFTIKAKDPQKFIAALERLCKKHAIARDEYQFRFNIEG